MRISLIITTYNWPQALELVLRSVEMQSQLPHEVIVADDGSSKSTADVVKDFQGRLQLPVDALCFR